MSHIVELLLVYLSQCLVTDTIPLTPWTWRVWSFVGAQWLLESTLGTAVLKFTLRLYRLVMWLFLSFFFFFKDNTGLRFTHLHTDWGKERQTQGPLRCESRTLAFSCWECFFFPETLLSLSLSPRLSPLLSLSLFQVVNAFTLLTVVSNQLVWVWVCVWVCECVSLISSGGGDPSRLCSDMSDHRSSSLLSLVESLDVGSSYSFDHFTGILAPLQ